jgi:hypothetical protein
MAPAADKQPKRYGIGAILLVVGGSILIFGLLGAVVASLLH